MNIIYKKAIPAHIPQICEIEKLCFTDPWSTNSFMEELNDDKARYIVAVVQEPAAVNIPEAADNLPGMADNTGGATDLSDMETSNRVVDVVAGYCGYWSIVGEAHITNVAVHPLFQRRGIGTGLLGAMLGDIVALGHTAATLEVREDNADAIRLYERFGFTQAGRRKKYYAREKKDALIMWNNFE